MHNYFEQSQFYGPITGGTSRNIFYGTSKHPRDPAEEDVSSKRLRKLLPAAEINPSSSSRSEEVQQAVAPKGTSKAYY